MALILADFITGDPCAARCARRTGGLKLIHGLRPYPGAPRLEETGRHLPGGRFISDRLPNSGSPLSLTIRVGDISLRGYSIQGWLMHFGLRHSHKLGFYALAAHCPSLLVALPA